MMLILGNALSLLGCLVMVASGLVKKKERILYLQCVQFGIMGCGNFILGAYSGVVANFISIVRNLLFAKVQGTTGLKLFFIVLQVVLTARNGIASPVDWLPVLATINFTWFLDTKSVVKFKVVNMAGQIMWAIYDFCYLNYAAFAFDILSLFSNLAGILLLRKEKRAESTEKD